MAKECVILLHGLGRSSYSMHHIEKALTKQGYHVINSAYPSRTKHIEQLVVVVDEVVKQCRALQAEQIHFVGHSLGGILVRQYFQNHHIPEAKRLIMLGSPNHGSEVSTRFKKQWWYRLSTGKAGQQLGIEADSLPNQLKAISLEIGVIAGTKSVDPWFGSTIPKPHDGKVSVASTQLDDMVDFIEVPYSHTFMMNKASVIRQISCFLKQGKFQR